MPRLTPASALLSCCLWVGAGCSGVGGHAEQDTTLHDSDGPEAPFVMGVNPTGEDDPALFTPLVDGDALEIEFGFQGLWMVVLAFKTRDTVDGLVTLFARVRTATETLGEFGIAKQLLIAGEDGFDYYLNFFLVVIGPEDVGEEAWVEMEAEDSDGQTVGGTVQVVLTGGTLPAFADAGSSQGSPDAHTDVGPDIASSDAEEPHDSQ